jgi:NNP family nitrate/nitrite transporter-like MFS transporter
MSANVQPLSTQRGSDPSTARPPWYAGGRRIDDWRPEDERFWASAGARVARRNLIFSIFAEHIGFSVWTMWAVLVLFLGPAYGFDPGQKFLLTTVPAALGCVLRVPYTLAVARFGGRTWTVVSALLLLIPTLATAVVLEPGVSFGTLLVVAGLAGVGGGNFASSMANINAFYPDRLKGRALGLNAGGGNLGVAGVQLVGLAVLATFGKGHPQAVCLFYVPLVILAAVGAALAMNNLSSVRNDKRALRDVCRHPHTWVISLLYIGTFGSFIGFSFAFGQVLQIQFKAEFSDPVAAASLTFLGPLFGSLIRPVGGALADRLGGASVTFWNFVAMAGAAAVVLTASLAHSLPLFVAGFIALFVFSGIGNGSAYKMIPSVFHAKAKAKIARGMDEAAAHREARRLSGALIGLAGAVGASGGVLVNIAFRQSFLSTGTGDNAYIAFLAFYALCFVTTWLVFLRRPQLDAARPPLGAVPAPATGPTAAAATAQG